MRGHRVVRAFPRAWRERYESELCDLLEAMAVSGRLPVRDQLDIVFAGLSERARHVGGSTSTRPRLALAGSLVLLFVTVATTASIGSSAPLPDRPVSQPLATGASFTQTPSGWFDFTTPGSIHLTVNDASHMRVYVPTATCFTTVTMDPMTGQLLAIRSTVGPLGGWPPRQVGGCS